MIRKRMRVHLHDKTRGREQNQAGSICLFRWHASFFLTNQSHHSIWMWNKFSFCVIPYHIKANSNATVGCWDAVHISSGCMCCLLIRPLLVKPQRNDRHAHKHYVHSQWLTNSSKDTLDTPWNQAWPFVIKTIDCKPKVWPLFQCLFAK